MECIGVKMTKRDNLARVFRLGPVVKKRHGYAV
jgi:hypothetical protein